MSNPFIPIQTASLEGRDALSFSMLGHSRYVFIEGNALIDRWASLAFETFNIAEIGFGTGLNFLLTWYLWEQHAPPGARLRFISCEKHPFKKEDLKKCFDLWPELAWYAQQLIDNYPVLTPGYHHLSFSNGRVALTLMLGDALEQLEQLLICGESTLELTLRCAFIDAWYLDAFAPKKNKYLWSTELLQTVSMLSKEGTTFAAYNAASVTAILQQVGFIVEEGCDQKGPMTWGYLKKKVPYKLKGAHTPWQATAPIQKQKKSALIIGAGLAGAFTAHALAKRGWQVVVVDELNTAGAGGSANEQAILFPKLSAYKSPLTQLMMSAFIYAHQSYKTLVPAFNLGELKGSLLLAYNEREQKMQDSLKAWLKEYPELGELIDAKEASHLAGLSLELGGMFIPLSGWINASALCQVLLENEGITLLTKQKVQSLIFERGEWLINDLSAPILILANGPQVNSFKETQHLPIKAIRGQMTAIEATINSSKLKRPVCAKGHVLPAIDGMHYVGATYDPLVTSPFIKRNDDEENKVKLDEICQDIWSNKVTGHWAGIRASTPDYLPLVGPAPQEEAFLALYAGLASNSKRWIPQSGPYYQGLYLCAGFGSRGLTTIPLCAEWLAASLNHEISCLPQNLVRALSPSRFLRKDIIQGLVNNCFFENIEKR